MAQKPRTSRRDDDELPGIEQLGEVEDHRSTVIYGRSGTGKTTLASTWPKPILYLDIRDRGTDSIADVKGIDRKRIHESDDIDEVLEWLLRNPKKYKTVVLDTMSQLQEIMVEEQGKKAKKKIRGSDGKRPGDFGTLSKQDWGQVASRMKSLIIDFRDLPMEVVFIAQDRVNREDDDEDGDDTLAPSVGPRLMPSVASVLNAAVSSIGNTFIRVRHVKVEDSKGRKRTEERKEYCLRVGPSSVYMTKLRKPKKVVAPDFIVDPDYEDIVDIIKGDV